MTSTPAGFHWQPPAKVNEQVFIGVAWGGVALTLVFYIARITTRFSAYRRLFWDDLLVLLAWLMLLTTAIIWQIYKGRLYENLWVSSGHGPIPATFPQDVTSYLKATLGVIILFYSSLWAIKFSFLIFFKRLGTKVKGQKIHWWIVFSFTLVTYIVSLGTPNFRCLTRSFTYIAGNCVTGKGAEFSRVTLRFMLVTDVLTDAAIITIPVHLLWNVRINLKQKLMLIGLFSLTIIVMLFAIVRVVVVSEYSYTPDQSWMYLWGLVEQTVAIVIACLASFRVLFTKQGSPSTEKKQPGFWWSINFSRTKRLLTNKGSHLWKSSKDGNSLDSGSDIEIHLTKSSVGSSVVTTVRAQDPTEPKQLLPQQIYVRRDFETASHHREPVQPPKTVDEMV